MKNAKLKAGHTYHYHNCGNHTSKLFQEEENYIYFLNLMKKYLADVADVYAFSLSPYHYHLLLKIKETDALHEKLKTKPYLAFSNLFNAYSKGFNKYYGREGSLFREHPKKILIQDDRDFLNTLIWIHVSSVKYLQYENFEEYPFSSYKIYLTNKKSGLNRERLFGIIEKRDYRKIHYQRKTELLKSTGYDWQT